MFIEWRGDGRSESLFYSCVQRCWNELKFIQMLSRWIQNLLPESLVVTEDKQAGKAVLQKREKLPICIEIEWNYQNVLCYYYFQCPSLCKRLIYVHVRHANTQQRQKRNINQSNHTHGNRSPTTAKQHFYYYYEPWAMSESCHLKRRMSMQIIAVLIHFHTFTFEIQFKWKKVKKRENEAVVSWYKIETERKQWKFTYIAWHHIVDSIREYLKMRFLLSLLLKMIMMNWGKASFAA